MKKRNTLVTLLKIFAAATITIHVINTIIDASAKLLDKLDHYKDKKIYKWKFGDIFYTKKGEGSPLLLIHDILPGSSGYEWSRIEEDLAEKHTVYTLDLPGCSRSDKPALTYTNFMYVQLITDFISNVIKEKTEIMTSGYSGSFAIMASQYNKEVIQSISMINPPDPKALSKIPGTKEQIINKIINLPVFGTLIYYIATCRKNIENDFAEKFYFNPFHIDGDMMDAYYEASHKNGSSGKYLFSSRIAKYTNFNIIPALSKSELPITIFFGKAESNQNEIEQRYSTFAPNAKIINISRSKHFPHIENTKEFLQKI